MGKVLFVDDHHAFLDRVLGRFEFERLHGPRSQRGRWAKFGFRAAKTESRPLNSRA
jgi:hypothetical protein